MRIIAVASLLLSLPLAVMAQAPALVAGKAVRIVVPAGAGGNPDVLARMLAPRLQAAWGTPVLVDNQPGAGGISAAIGISKSAPDGHLLFFGVSVPQRSLSMPDVPTLDEQGVKGFNVATTMGLQTSAGLSKTLVTLFQQTFAKALREPDITGRINNLGMVLMENGTENYVQYMKDELLRYASAVKVAGIKFE